MCLLAAICFVLVAHTPGVASGMPQASGPAPSPIPTYVALRTTGEPFPNPVQGELTFHLSTGATVRLRVVDVDYERTGAYRNRVIVKAETTSEVGDGAARRFKLVFPNQSSTTVAIDDVDFAEMRAGFPVFHKRVAASAGMTMSNYNRMIDGVTVDDVNEWLGVTGTQSGSSTYGDYSGAIYQWKRDGAIVTAMFVNGKLVSKSQVGIQ